MDESAHLEGNARAARPHRDVTVVPTRRPGGVVIALLGLIAFAAAGAWLIVKPQDAGMPAPAPSPAVAGGPDASQPLAEQEPARAAQAPAPEAAEAARSEAKTSTAPASEEGRVP